MNHRPMVRQIALAGVASLCFLSGAPSAPAATLFVSPQGSPEPTGSAAAPFGDIRQAVEAAGRGDTIVVNAGTYHLSSTVWINKPQLRLTGVAGEPAILTADENVPALVTIVADGVTLQHLTLQGGFYGIKVDVDQNKFTRNVSIRNCQIGQTAADCIKLFNADNVTIDSCRIGPSGWKQKENAEGIDAIGSLRITVRSCLIEDIATNGVYFKGGTRNGVVERCIIRRCGFGGILLGQDTDEQFMRDGVRNEAIDCVARNNIVLDTKMAGLGAYSAKNVSFINNTLIDVAKEGQAGLWVVTNTRDVPSEGVTFLNNIVVVGGDRPVLFTKDAAGFPSGNHNLFASRKGMVRFYREMSADESMTKTWPLGQWQSVSAQDAHSREVQAADLKLDNLYRPMAGSPAIGGGQAAKGSAEDYYGKKRDAASYDIGAVQSSPSPVATTP